MNNIELIQDIEKRLQSLERSKATILSTIEDITYFIEARMYKLNKNGILDTSKDEQLKIYNEEILKNNKQLETRNYLIEFFKFKLEQLKNQ